MENYKRKSLRVDSSFPSDNDENNCVTGRSRDVKAIYLARKSIIIDLKGNTKEFTASTQDWINEILGVTGYDKREKATNIAGQKAD